MIEIDIFGTCFTRELFNTTNKYKVKTYLMQQSIYTMESKPLVIRKKEAKSTDNYNFKHRMIYYEFNKIAMRKMLEDPAEYLVIDLTDMCRDILEFEKPNGVKVISTKDTLFTLEQLKKKKKYEDIIFHNVDVRKLSNNEIKCYLKKFVNKIITKYNKEKIILNRVQMQNIYYENNVEKYLNNDFPYDRKQFVEKVEKIFLQILPNCKILYPKYEPIVDINHVLGGPHPMHFEAIYYEYRMSLLDAIITNSNTFAKIDKKYKKTYDENISNIKNKICAK
ncbi:MAG: DUF6270 domain-containing protein [Bacilli bacterium]|nr:DUF6270 domain-containing protein [Bacilli bacterium]